MEIRLDGGGNLESVRIRGAELACGMGARKKMPWPKKAEELRQMDAPLAGEFQPDDTVVISQQWTGHWSFQDYPARTTRWWYSLMDGPAVVKAVDQTGMIVVGPKDESHFPMRVPVPARFVSKP